MEQIFDPSIWVDKVHTYYDRLGSSNSFYFISITLSYDLIDHLQAESRWVRSEVSKSPTIENGVHQIRDIQTQFSHNLQEAQATQKKSVDRFQLDPSPDNSKCKVGTFYGY